MAHVSISCANGESAAVPCTIQLFRTAMPILLGHERRPLEIRMVSAQMIAARTGTRPAELDEAVAPFVVPDLPWTPFFHTATEEAAQGMGTPMPEAWAVFARASAVEYPMAEARAAGASALQLLGGLGDPLAEELMYAVDSVPLDRARRLVVPQRLSSHPALRGQRIGERLLRAMLHSLELGSEDLTVVDACPIPTVWGPRDADGLPAPVDRGLDAQQRLAGWYERLGFERLPSKLPWPATTLARRGSLPGAPRRG